VVDEPRHDFFPVPDSPVNSTVVSVAATRVAWANLNHRRHATT
jgi:hypothetical protein